MMTRTNKKRFGLEQVANKCMARLLCSFSLAAVFIQTEAVDAYATQLVYGNHCDNIQINGSSRVEFEYVAGAGRENTTSKSGIPGLRVSGSITAPFDVQIEITGGTATLGSDYTTPNGTDTFTITIPAGNYNGKRTIPVGITIIQDDKNEAYEMIKYRIVPVPAFYKVASTKICDAPPYSFTSYTIIDPHSASRRSFPRS